MLFFNKKSHGVILRQITIITDVLNEQKFVLNEHLFVRYFFLFAFFANSNNSKGK